MVKEPRQSAHGRCSMEVNAVDEAVLKQYLLGDLPADQQQAVEERLLESDEWFEQLLIAEHDLVEDYVGGGLPSAERDKLERRLLSTTEQRAEVDFARMLMKIATEREGLSPRASPPAGRWRALTQRASARRIVLPLALAAAAIIMVGVWWMLVRPLHDRLALVESETAAATIRQRELEKQLADQRARATALAGQLEQEQQQRALLEKQLNSLRGEASESQPAQRKPAESSRQMLAQVQIMTLRPGSTRDVNEAGAGELLIRPDTKRVRLLLELINEDVHQDYRAVLQTADGATIATLRSLRKAGPRVVAAEFSAQLLPASDLLLKLYGVAASEKSQYLGSYAFRIGR